MDDPLLPAAFLDEIDDYSTRTDYPGLLDLSTTTRAPYSSDAGNYRIVPEAVCFPKSIDDVLAVLDACRRHKVPITSRGGGTSCAGNAVGPGVVIDFTRHMNRVLSIDPEARTATVEPGCIQSTLQEAAAPYGLRFGPDPSSMNRCSIGGMVGNNACGPHATAWGRTSDNVISLDCIDGLGRRFTARLNHASDTFPSDTFPTDSSPSHTSLGDISSSDASPGHISPSATSPGRSQAGAEHTGDEHVGDAHSGTARDRTVHPDAKQVGTAHAAQEPLAEIPGLARLVDANLALIRTELGRFGRQVSGYSLEHLTPEGGRNLAAMLVGTEGTLVTVLSATVRLVPLPTAPVLVTLGYPTMAEAADDVPALLAHKPLAVEGLDARLVDVVRQHKGPGAVPTLPDGQGWLMVEVGGHDAEDSMTRARALAASASTTEVLIYPPGDNATTLWRIRADGAGLGGRTPINPQTGQGNRQAWPGLEDAAVPPENLGAYLRDFDALCAQYEVDGLLFGHFGDGCVHVRLDLPLHTPDGVEHSRRFLEDSARLIASYGGSVSGEHGDGRARSELLRFMYSPNMLDLFAQVKHLFDPHNLLNPGVLTAPMAPLAAQQRASARDDNEAARGPLSVSLPAGDGRATAASSTPNAASPDPPYLPYSTGLQPGIDRVDEHLRRPYARPISADQGFAFHEDDGDFTTAIHRCTGVGKCRANVAGTFMCPSYAATGDEKDVTRGRARMLQEAANGTFIGGLEALEVSLALDLCLACKACSSDCPAGVDMAKYRSEVLFRRFRGKIRPASHYSLGWLPRWTRLTARIPGLAALGNLTLSFEPLRRLAFQIMGMDPRRKMAPLRYGTFTAWARRHGAGDARKLSPAGTPVVAQVDRPVGHTHHGQPRYVLLWADSFSQTLESRGAQDLLHLLRRHGFTVLIAPDACCGLTWITTGQLDTARKKLSTLVDTLAPYAVNGIPIIGVEPSCTAVLRDDLIDLLPDDPRAHAIKAATHTLAELLATVPEQERQLPNLAGVEIVAQPHCHHYSVMGWSADRTLLQSLGATVTELSGCCGLAGNFGMEQGHYDVSVAVAERSLLPTLRDKPDAIYLADGFSCRTQARQIAERDGIHLATLLNSGHTSA